MEAVSSLTPADRSQPLRWLVFRIFPALVYIYIFATVLLPSGSIFGVNVKDPVYLLLLPCAIYVFLHRHFSYFRLIFLLIVPTAFALWVFLSIIVYQFNTGGALRQFADIILMLFTCWIAFLYCGDDEKQRMRFLRLVLIAEFATCFIKVALVGYALKHGMSILEIGDMLDKIFDVKLMTGNFGGNDGNVFGRLQFMSDSLIPICIFVILRHRESLKIGKLRALGMIAVLIGSDVLSFSRYLWIYAAVAFVLGLLLGKRDRFQAIIIGVLVTAAIFSMPLLLSLYQVRFSSAIAGQSDLARVEQIRYLKQFFFDAPIFGHGLGSYVTHLLRANAENMRYSYEVELLALSGQIGMLGIMLFVALGAYYYRGLWHRSHLPAIDRITLILLLLLWLSAGLFNPFVLNPVAGVSYSVFAILSTLREPYHRALRG